MRTYLQLLLLLLIICIIENCSPPVSQEQGASSSNSLAAKTTFKPLTPTVRGKEYNLQDMNARVATFKERFGEHYDEVPYASIIQGQLFLFVIKGEWKENYWNEDKQKAPKTYQVGLVTEENKCIIPVKYDKIYNMGGTAANLIEVELDGKFGAYDITGKQLLKPEFDGIYPYKKGKGVWVQVRKGKNFGWLSTNEIVQMDANSHEDEELFKAPTISKLIENWNFDSDSLSLIPIFNVIDTGVYDEGGLGLIVLPSYLYQLGIVPEFQRSWMVHPSSFGNESTVATVYKSKKVGQVNTLMTTFNQTFMDARGYSTENYDVVTVNDQLERVDVLPIEVDMDIQICSNDIKLQFVTDNIIEIKRTGLTNYSAYKLMTHYRYYRITPDGKIMPLDVKGDFQCTRIIKMTDSYFEGCYSRDITEDELLEAQANENEENEFLNYTQFQHLSIEDLDVMRNEIFAAHGYQFKNKKWQDYFSSKSWYQAQFDDVNDQLTAIEKHNIQVILDLKEKMKDNEAQYIKKTYGAFIAAG